MPFLSFFACCSQNKEIQEQAEPVIANLAPVIAEKKSIYLNKSQTLINREFANNQLFSIALDIEKIKSFSKKHRKSSSKNPQDLLNKIEHLSMKYTSIQQQLYQFYLTVDIPRTDEKKLYKFIRNVIDLNDNVKQCLEELKIGSVKKNRSKKNGPANKSIQTWKPNLGAIVDAVEENEEADQALQPAL